MLLALRYTDDGILDAAALACDQQPYGMRYWQEMHSQPVSAQPCMETAYVDVKDEQLAEQLLDDGFDDGREAALAVDAYLDSRATPP